MIGKSGREIEHTTYNKMMVSNVIVFSAWLSAIVRECASIAVWQDDHLESAGLGRPKRSFEIDHTNNRFLLDGQPFQIIGAHMHYYTVVPDLWEQRLKMARSMGVNTIGLYVPWNLHEPEQGEFNWEGFGDIERLLNTANKLGLLVNLRPSPYIDSEWEAGGHPAWLLKDTSIKLRYTGSYAKAVKKWYDVLLPKLSPYTYDNGGPTIMAQIENEYGGWPLAQADCDNKQYLEFLRDLLRHHLGPNIVLYTTDACSDWYMNCGGVNGSYRTGDFGLASFSDVKGMVAAERRSNPEGGPFVNSEYYPLDAPWFDSWGEAHHHTGTPEAAVSTLESIWAFNGSVSLYMGVGGTFWGYTSGAYLPESGYFPVTTSYDYDAPVSEAGDPTPKLLAIRAAVEKNFGLKIPYPVPKPSFKANYGKVKLNRIGSVLDLLSTLSPSSTGVVKTYPVNVEQLSLPFYYGFLLYESVAPLDGSSLTIEGVADRAYVMVNGDLISILQRVKHTAQPSIQVAIKKEDKIQILVENQGRLCHDYLYDYKGILGNVTIDKDIVTNWTHYPVNISKLVEALEDPNQLEHMLANAQKRAKNHRSGNRFSLPSFYYRKHYVPVVADTFLNPANWTKGQAFVNGVNIGRYWPAKGPQVTLYLPAPYVKPKTNILLFELDGAGNCDDATKTTCSIELVDHMVYN